MTRKRGKTSQEGGLGALGGLKLGKKSNCKISGTPKEGARRKSSSLDKMGVGIRVQQKSISPREKRGENNLEKRV